MTIIARLYGCFLTDLYNNKKNKIENYRIMRTRREGKIQNKFLWELWSCRLLSRTFTKNLEQYHRSGASLYPPRVFVCLIKLKNINKKKRYIIINMRPPKRKHRGRHLANCYFVMFRPGTVTNR